MPGMYKAKLIGSDGYSPPSKQFGSVADAVAWMHGEGLAEFEGDDVRGEVSNAEGFNAAIRGRPFSRCCFRSSHFPANTKVWKPFC